MRFPSNMVFDVKTGRSAYIEFTKPVTFYSLPDSISFRMFVKDDLVKELYLDFASNTKVSFEKVRLEPAWGIDSVYSISFMDNGIPLDLIEYPLTLTGMKFYLKPGMTFTDTRISFKDLTAQKMIVEFAEGSDPKAVMKAVLKNCKKVEDDCEIYL